MYEDIMYYTVRNRMSFRYLIILFCGRNSELAGLSELNMVWCGRVAYEYVRSS